ncbi:MAG: CDP-glucose 4,6-dehydratase [Lachnospiraceae bacterium]|nr:CDP-glucose 4,6-dehydratase [Lachnospiraceae bacterium]
MKRKEFTDFYKGKKVLITGHTGFKGSWLCAILKQMGADVCGYALAAPAPSLFYLTNMAEGIRSVEGDIRDLRHMQSVFDDFTPEIVIHMAAQPIVRESYLQPVLTYETNVMGTVHMLECVRKCKSVRSVVNVTTDKVYFNKEQEQGYVETDILDGYDPYSNSKSCSELVTHSYIQSFLEAQGVAVSTCRAGNVLGGGDFAKDRIIPDCVRAAFADEAVILRNPHSTRPYQHVLEPLFVYLTVAMKQYENPVYAGCYNVGPDDQNNVTTGVLADRFCHLWNAFEAEEGGDDSGSFSSELRYKIQGDGGPHEAGFLKLDCTKLKSMFLWQPTWNIDDTLRRIVEFEKKRMQLERDHASADATAQALNACMQKQISEFLG